MTSLTLAGEQELEEGIPAAARFLRLEDLLLKNLLNISLHLHFTPPGGKTFHLFFNSKNVFISLFSEFIKLFFFYYLITGQFRGFFSSHFTTFSDLKNKNICWCFIVSRNGKKVISNLQICQFKKRFVMSVKARMNFFVFLYVRRH